MPVLAINDPKSLANGKLAFHFDTSKPRVGTKKAKRRSLNRMNLHRAAEEKPPLKPSDIDSYHHLNQDRSCGNYNNLFAAISNQQHNNIELQGIECFTTLFNSGKVGFDYVTKKYFISDEKLAEELKEWQSKGCPKRWDIRCLHQKPKEVVL